MHQESPASGQGPIRLVGRAQFGTTNTQFVYNLLGNTQIMRNVRQVTKSVNPKELAVWPLSPFVEQLCRYLYEIYDTNIHPALGESPEMHTIMAFRTPARDFTG